MYLLLVGGLGCGFSLLVKFGNSFRLFSAVPVTAQMGLVLSARLVACLARRRLLMKSAISGSW